MTVTAYKLAYFYNGSNDEDVVLLTSFDKNRVYEIYNFLRFLENRFEKEWEQKEKAAKPKGKRPRPFVEKEIPVGAPDDVILKLVKLNQKKKAEYEQKAAAWKEYDDALFEDGQDEFSALESYKEDQMEEKGWPSEWGWYTDDNLFIEEMEIEDEHLVKE